MSVDKRYWDSSSFLAWLNQEDGWEKCEPVLKAAEDGKLLLFTSALTLTEVIKLKGRSPLDRRKQADIKAFFDLPYIDVRDVDRFIAEEARSLMWDYGHLRSRDAIHLATALLMSIPRVESFDNDFLRLDGKIGQPPIKIVQPHQTMQEILKI